MNVTDFMLRQRAEMEPIVGTFYDISRLYWDHAYGLMQLEGASPVELIGPNYLVLSYRKGRVTEKRPHLRELKIAIIHKAPKELGLVGVFGEVRRRFC